MTQYTTEPCASGEWYFVTDGPDGQWIEGGDMSESTARAVAERLNGQATEIERLRDAVAYLRTNVIQDAGTLENPFSYVCGCVWKEFERRVSGE